MGNMQKLIAMSFFIFCGAISTAAAVSGDYCLLDYNGGDGLCYWCAPGGDSGGYCRPPYPGCPDNPQRVVALGDVITVKDAYGNTTTRKCRSDGFCFPSCTGERWFNDGNGFEMLQLVSGCMCDYWTSTSNYRCAEGYFESIDSPYQNGCDRCPSMTNVAGDVVYGTSVPSENHSITDCVMKEGVVFSDNSGEYTFISGCAYTE